MIAVGRPSDFLNADLNLFIELVLSGSEVTEHTLRHNVPRAARIAIAREKAEILAVARRGHPRVAFGRI